MAAVHALWNKKESAAKLWALRRSWVLAAIYFRGACCPTIIDVPMFHFRVRDGTGWGHWAVTTRLQPASVVYWLPAACPGAFARPLSLSLWLCFIGLGIASSVWW